MYTVQYSEDNVVSSSLVQYNYRLNGNPGADFIKELRLAELKIAERAHWSLLRVFMTTTNAHVLQSAILQVQSAIL